LGKGREVGGFLESQTFGEMGGSPIRGTEPKETDPTRERGKKHQNFPGGPHPLLKWFQGAGGGCQRTRPRGTGNRQFTGANKKKKCFFFGCCPTTWRMGGEGGTISRGATSGGEKSGPLPINKHDTRPNAQQGLCGKKKGGSSKRIGSGGRGGSKGWEKIKSPKQNENRKKKKKQRKLFVRPGKRKGGKSVESGFAEKQREVKKGGVSQTKKKFRKQRGIRTKPSAV